MTLSYRDKAFIWHPFTQHRTSRDEIVIKRGEGSYLIDEDNKRYLDLISSWWVNLHGHAHPEIAKAIYEQALTLEQVIFSGFTHEPAINLAEALLTILPAHFSKIFYSDNGSSAVEVALKMAYQYWRNQGFTKKNRFISFEKSYHGDTIGAMSVGKKSGFFVHFEDLLFPVDVFPYPETWMEDDNIEEKENNVLNKLSDFLLENAHETAALIIEPLVQGAGGMRMCRPEFLLKLEKLIHAHDVLIIYDEVMTGFGRTGDYFACKKANSSPDLICLAKGLTGGFLPLAVTACSQKIYDAFLSDQFSNALAHGHSFTANPLGCAAAIASLRILQQSKTLIQIKMIEKTHHNMLSYINHTTPNQKARYCGTIAAFELPSATEYGSKFSILLREKFARQGLLLRPLGNVIYFLPPFCITEKELKGAYEFVINEIQGITA